MQGILRGAGGTAGRAGSGREHNKMRARAADGGPRAVECVPSLAHIPPHGTSYKNQSQTRVGESGGGGGA